MRRWGVSVLSLAMLATGCRRSDAPKAPDAESWSVTGWGERYEVFAETDALLAGAPASSTAHVTVLEKFTPLTAGAVTAVLRGAGGAEQRFRQERPRRDGIFPVTIEPKSEGSFDLFFRIEGPAGEEEILAGRVRVGSASSPGGLIKSEAPQASEGLPFLKEQQWRTDFATARVEEGTLRETLVGPGRILPARGGEVVLTAAADAAVAPDPWPYRGQDVAAGATVFRLLPRITDRSLPELAAQAEGLRAEKDAARRRVERLTELVRLEATSQAELERARAALVGLEARLAAAQQGLDVASGGTRSAGELMLIRAPWPGRVAEVSVTPGQSVAAGTPLGRLVRPRPLWLEVALRPEDAARFDGAPAALFLRRPGLAEPAAVPGSALRFVSVAPEVDASTATIAVLLELDRSADDLPIGSSAEVELALPAERRGIVVPQSALADDAGVAVAYVQLSGEAFARRELRVLARAGDRVLVSGLDPGERLVTRGAGAIRRSALISSGTPEGHVH